MGLAGKERAQFCPAPFGVFDTKQQRRVNVFSFNKICRHKFIFGNKERGKFSICFAIDSVQEKENSIF